MRSVGTHGGRAKITIGCVELSGSREAAQGSRGSIVVGAKVVIGSWVIFLQFTGIAQKITQK